MVPVFVLLHGNGVNFSAASSASDGGCKKPLTIPAQKDANASHHLVPCFLQAGLLRPGELWRKNDVIFPRPP